MDASNDSIAGELLIHSDNLNNNMSNGSARKSSAGSENDILPLCFTELLNSSNKLSTSIVDNLLDNFGQFIETQWSFGNDSNHNDNSNNRNNSNDSSDHSEWSNDSNNINYSAASLKDFNTIINDYKQNINNLNNVISKQYS